MGRTALLLLLLSCLAPTAAPLPAAPAPLPRRDPESLARPRERLFAERRRKLDEMGVKWSVELRDGVRRVVFECGVPKFGLVRGSVPENGDLCHALDEVVSVIESLRSDVP